MATTKVTRNFQITLPKEIRKTANIRMGDTLNIVADAKGEVRIKKSSARQAVLNAAGLWKDVKDSAEYVRALRDRWKERPRL